jgi:hypothetical protein
MEASFEYPVPAVLLNCQASSSFGITLSDLLSEGQSITLDIYGHLISSMQNDIGDMIDDLVMPVPVHLDEKVESGS